MWKIFSQQFCSSFLYSLVFHFLWDSSCMYFRILKVVSKLSDTQLIFSHYLLKNFMVCFAWFLLLLLQVHCTVNSQLKTGEVSRTDSYHSLCVSLIFCSFRATSPYLAQLLLLREPGSQDPTAPQAAQSAHLQDRQVLQTVTQADCHCSQVSETGNGEMLTTYLVARLRDRGDLGEGSGALQDAPKLVPCVCQLTHWLKARQPGGTQVKEWDPTLISLQPENQLSNYFRLNGPLSDAHRQLVVWGRGHLQHQPMAEQDH